jgi:hypothetical protein
LEFSVWEWREYTVLQNSWREGKPGFSVTQKHIICEESFQYINLPGIVLPDEKQIFP